MQKLRFFSLMLVAMVFAANGFAQTDRQHVRMGNKLFRKGAYADAEVEYKKALTINENNTQAIYNLGCALLQQGQDSMAVEQFEQAGRAETNKVRKAMAYHNIGVVMQSSQNYGQAIEAYKEALRNNPHDDMTRYNLVLCKRQQQQQQQDQKQNQQNNKDNKDQNKDQKKDQNKDQKKDNNKDQNKNQDQNKDKDQNQDQSNPQPQQMSKENAQQLLNAAIQDEKRTQDRLQKAMQQPRRKALKKNW